MAQSAAPPCACRVGNALVASLAQPRYCFIIVSAEGTGGPPGGSTGGPDIADLSARVASLTAAVAKQVDRRRRRLRVRAARAGVGSSCEEEGCGEDVRAVQLGGRNGTIAGGIRDGAGLPPRPDATLANVHKPAASSQDADASEHERKESDTGASKRLLQSAGGIRDDVGMPSRPDAAPARLEKLPASSRYCFSGLVQDENEVKQDDFWENRRRSSGRRGVRRSAAVTAGRASCDDRRRGDSEESRGSAGAAVARAADEQSFATWTALQRCRD